MFLKNAVPSVVDNCFWSCLGRRWRKRAQVVLKFSVLPAPSPHPNAAANVSEPA